MFKRFERYIGPAAVAAALLILGSVMTADAARRFPWPAEIIAGNDGTDQQVVYVDSSGSVAVGGGGVASGATDSGNPVKVGGVYNSTRPTFTNGQRGDLQLDTRGNFGTVIWSQDSVVSASVSATSSDASTLGNGALFTKAFGMTFNGTNFDRTQAVQNSTNSVGTGITAAGLVGQCDDTSPTALTENSFGNARVGCADHSQLIGVNAAGVATAMLSAANSLNSTGAGLATSQAVGQCDDTTPTALTENSFGNVRMDCVTHALRVDGGCNQQVAIAVTAAATTQLIALSGSTVIRVCSIKTAISATGSYTLLSGTGSNCGTPANSTGAMPLITGNADNWGDGTGVVWQGSAGGELCMTAVTGNLTGIIRYSQY